MKSGFVLIDKPVGVSSFDVVRQCRRAFQTKKCGHAGTLDPLASGLLLVAINHATRLLRFLELEPKGYEFDIVLGAQTNTDDDEGDVIAESDAAHVGIAEIADVIPRFSGEISQQPPLYSAIHIDGVRAYKRARAGESFEVPFRDVSVFELSCFGVEAQVARCYASVSSGTYIRSLARDIGFALGTHAHARAIRRTNLATLDLANAVSLEALSASNLVPAAEVLTLPERNLSSGELNRIRQGQVIDAMVSSDSFVSLLADGIVVGVAEQTGELLQPRVVFPEHTES